METIHDNDEALKGDMNHSAGIEAAKKKLSYGIGMSGWRVHVLGHTSRAGDVLPEHTCLGFHKNVIVSYTKLIHNFAKKMFAPKILSSFALDILSSSFMTSTREGFSLFLFIIQTFGRLLIQSSGLFYLMFLLR